MDKLKKIAGAPSLKMISFTITEKGYACTDISGNILGFIEKDIENGIDAPSTALGIVTALLYERFISGKYPIALVSMDNCSQK